MNKQETKSVVENFGNKIQCQFFVKKKKRLCRMTVKKGEQFCGEHIDSKVSNNAALSVTTASNDKRLRVPCPYDSNHTCFKNKLRKHTAKCNSKPGKFPIYIVPGYNSGNDNEELPEKVTLHEITDSDLLLLIEKIREIHSKYISINEYFGEHPILKEELKRPDFGATTKKHLIQTSALLSLLESKELLNNNTCFIEMGAGKGKLTYWLIKALTDHKKCTYALVDRASYRHKSENKLKTEEFEPIRIRADIGDLCLRNVESINNNENVVITSKHLCGVATDLALRCIVNSVETDNDSKWNLKGLIIALCCHHRCLWQSYVGKQFFNDVGLSPKDFTAMCVLTSWATCGSGRSRQISVENEKKTEQEIREENKHKDRYDRLNLPVEVRELIGRQCKDIIDCGRKLYLNKCGFNNSELLHYVKQCVTLENVCLIASL